MTRAARPCCLMAWQRRNVSGVLRIQRDVTTLQEKRFHGVADNSYLDGETLHTSAYVLRAN